MSKVGINTEDSTDGSLSQLWLRWDGIMKKQEITELVNKHHQLLFLSGEETTVWDRDE